MKRCAQDGMPWGRRSSSRWLCLIAILSAMLLFPGGLWCQDSGESGFKDFVDSLGKSLYFMAWPTAQYEGVTFGGVSSSEDAKYITFRLYGKSAFDDGPLWVDTIIEVRNGQITDLRWGRNNAILAAPGSTITAMGQALAQLNEDYQRSHHPAEQGFGYFFTNQCNKPVSLAILYKDLSGQWQTAGWWQFAPGASDYLKYSNGSRVTSTSAAWYFYAESGDGSFQWKGTQKTSLEGRTLYMKEMNDKEGDSEWSVQCR
jgi:hypothetical protein